jgi:hypothetical protein
MVASRIRLLAACLLVAAVLTSVLAACSDDVSSTVAGEVVPGRPSLGIVGDFGYVLLPTGRIDVVVGEAVSRVVRADEASDDLDHETPDGGSWIPVHVAHDPFGEMGVPVGLTGGSPQPAAVALVIDGETVNLGAPYRVVGEQGTADSGLDNVWVAVGERPDEIESVQVAVTYDGLTQTLDPRSGDREAGAAEPLYVREADELTATCDPQAFSRARLSLEGSCAIGPAQRTPYLPGAGWADEGRSWLVVGAAVVVDSVRDGRRSFGIDSIQPRLTVDGQVPLPSDGRFGEVRHDPDRASATWAFDAPATGGVEVELTLDISPDAGQRTITVSQVVELGS